MINRRNLLASGSAAAMCAAIPASAGSSPVSRSRAESQKLTAVFDRIVDETLDDVPELATAMGLDTGKKAPLKHRLSDMSPAADARRRQTTARQLAALKGIRRDALTGLDRRNYDAVLYDVALRAAAAKRFPLIGSVWSPYVLHQLGGVYVSAPDFLDSQHAVTDKTDAEAYLDRLAAFGNEMDEEIESVRHDVTLGVIPPDFVVDRSLGLMGTLRSPAPEASSLTGSIARRTKEKGIAGDYAGRAAKIVAEKVYPALDRQIALMKDLRGKAKHDAGVYALPDGDAYYAAMLETQTTTTRTPDEVHALGLEIVAECTAQIDAIMKAQGLTTGTVGERLKGMFADPKFLYANTDAGKTKLLADLNAKLAQVRAQLPAYFGTLPKADIFVRRIPEAIEASQPGGYYMNGSLDGKRPGTVYINLRDTAEVPSWTLPTLIFHEGIPGHHMQISISQETKLPLLRKMAQYNAYVEGWAVYAEELAVEMGLYENDPWGHIGQLHDAMLRAVRLVVDTGLHAKRWSREKAIAYYSGTLGDPESGATSEVERYCVWPGQACGYMIGKRTIQGLREKAQKTLTARFDIKAFHDAVLLSGALPLQVLDEAVSDYVAKATA